MTNDLQSEQPIRRRWLALAKIAGAHTIMLRDAGLIDDDALATLLGAIERAGGSQPAGETFPALLATFDERVDAQTPPGMTGASRVGRGTPEMIATAARLLLRANQLTAMLASARLRRTLIAFARQHVVTLMPVYLDGQFAQPSTLGHVVAAVLGPLGRATARLEAALAETNRSPMGSGALASSGMPVDRERVAALLGFDGPIANTLDAVSATDHLSLSADALAALAVPIRRFAEELLTWHRGEPASFRLADGMSGFVAELPQTRVPLALEELVAAARLVEAAAASVRTLGDARPLAPWFGGVDELLEALDALFARVRSMLQQAETVVTSLDVNRALLANRASKGFGTSSDLADFLMIEEQIDPGAARNIAAITISRTREQGMEASGITPDLIDGAAMLVIGREIKAEFEAISRYLAPRRFIERRTATGAPSPSATRALLDAEEQQLDREAAELADVQARFRVADDNRARIAAEVRSLIDGIKP